VLPRPPSPGDPEPRAGTERSLAYNPAPLPSLESEAGGPQPEPMSNENTPAVRKCAELARLEITPEEEQRLGGDFERILEAFRGLTELDVRSVEPMFGAATRENVVREDETRASLETDELLAPAPRKDDGFFTVPKTVDGDA